MLHKGPLRVEMYLDILIIKVTQENDDPQACHVQRSETSRGVALNSVGAAIRPIAILRCAQSLP